jgi:hypothetical protein
VLLGLQLIEQLAIQEVASLIGNAASVAQAKVIGPQIAAAYAGAATAVSTATYGVAAGVGATAEIAALGTITGALVGAGGFRQGGYTGDGSAGEIAGPAHKKEFVFTAEETAALTVPFLQKLAANAGGVARFHQGGDMSVSDAGRLATGGPDARIAYDPATRTYYSIDPSIEPTPIPNQPPSDASRIPGTDLVYDPGSGLVYNASGLNYSPGTDVSSPAYQDPSVTVTSPYIPPETFSASPPPMPSVLPEGYPSPGWNSPGGTDPGWVDNATSSGSPGSPSIPNYGTFGSSGASVLPGGAVSVGGGWTIPTEAQSPELIWNAKLGWHMRRGPVGSGLTGVKNRHSGGLAGDEFLAILQKEEFIMQKAAVAHYGPDLMHAINNMRVPSHHAGGAAGDASSSRLSPTVEHHHHYLWMDEGEAMRKWAESREGRKTIGQVRFRGR